MIVFFVEGEPRAKQSFRVGNHGGYQPARVKAWQTDVAWIAQQATRKAGLIEPLQGYLTVEMTFFLGNSRRIDCDNLSKAIQDAMNGIVYKDDRSNIRVVIEKYICRERHGVLVKVSENWRPVEISKLQMNEMISIAETYLEPIVDEVVT